MITVSLCMIVRNEEDVISKCLDSVSGLVDEIVIVDTGSTDNTKEIVKKYTTNIYNFEWIYDFSAARNYSFSKASMDYIMWLDADDVILEEDRKKFERLRQTLNPAVDIVMMKYNTGFDEQGNVILSYCRERLIKRSKGYKWCEPVHECIDIKGNIANSDVCITHNKLHVQAKDRNLKIFEDMVSHGKELSPRSLFYFARELQSAGRYYEAVMYFNKFLNMGKGWLEDKINACAGLSLCYKNLNDPQNRLKSLLRSFEYDTPRADICCELGVYYMGLNDYQKAIFWLDLATKVKPPELNWGFVLHDCWGFIPNQQLSVCYGKLGNIEEAIKYNNKAAEYKPNHPVVLNNKKLFESFVSKPSPSLLQ